MNKRTLSEKSIDMAELEEFALKNKGKAKKDTISELIIAGLLKRGSINDLPKE
jgi:hypothetical protein